MGSDASYFSTVLRTLLILQGLYFTATGIWPILDIRSFEAVTGPKADRWLVKTVGLCIACIGGTLLAAAKSHRVTPEIRGLAVGSATCLAGVDIWYTARGRISSVYLVDAACELALAAGLTTASSRPRQPDLGALEWHPQETPHFV